MVIFSNSACFNLARFLFANRSLLGGLFSSGLLLGRTLSCFLLRCTFLVGLLLSGGLFLGRPLRRLLLISLLRDLLLCGSFRRLLLWRTTGLLLGSLLFSCHFRSSSSLGALLFGDMPPWNTQTGKLALNTRNDRS